MQAEAAASRASARWRVWLAGARPRTLVIAAAPVLVGAAQAATMTPHPAWGPVAAAGVSAMCIQIATNLANDAADGARGHDGPARLGPPRIVASGLAPAADVRRAALVATLVAALFGLLAVAQGGWPILAIGVASLAAGWAYSFGPRPISATPWGEVFVVAFFGVLAVAGVVWLGAGRVDARALALGLAVGLPAAAVLTVNNHRDRDGDAANGRRTLAILLGPRRTVRLYAAELAGAALVAAAALAPASGLAAGLAAAAALPGFGLARRLALTPPGRALNARLADTALYLVFLALLIAALVLARP
ncbi:MAG: 1,4-dihydroxy-2-naphthoate octaprenyltransferase [Rhizobiales bacterium]|nr:1,4-dihydroxy-2-naphthoate octaprenyltransferase [Hyphomicrobiales bacterium]